MLGMGLELTKSNLDLLLLAVLRPAPLHGYAIISALKDRSEGEFDLPEGTVYPALHRLEARDLIVSSTETVSGRRRRTYRLTRGGRAALERERKEWERTVTRVRAVLGVTS